MIKKIIKRRVTDQIDRLLSGAAAIIRFIAGVCLSYLGLSSTLMHAFKPGGGVYLNRAARETSLYGVSTASRFDDVLPERHASTVSRWRCTDRRSWNLLGSEFVVASMLSVFLCLIMIVIWVTMCAGRTGAKKTLIESKY